MKNNYMCIQWIIIQPKKKNRKSYGMAQSRSHNTALCWIIQTQRTAAPEHTEWGCWDMLLAWKGTSGCPSFLLRSTTQGPLLLLRTPSTTNQLGATGPLALCGDHRLCQAWSNEPYLSSSSYKWATSQGLFVFTWKVCLCVCVRERKHPCRCKRVCKCACTYLQACLSRSEVNDKCLP